MAKIDPLTTITSGFNSTAQLNSNFIKITAALANTISRDGSSPNQMDAVFDMNSNRIINLSDPVNNQDAVTKSFLTSFTSGSVDLAAAAASAAAALVSETNAATSETNASSSENSQIRFTFDVSTSMADPGVGDFRYNNAVVASVTAIAFDASMAQTGNPDVSDYIATWDDSTNAVTGHITFIKRGNAEVFAVFTVSAVSDNTGWLEVTVAHVSSSGTFSDTDAIDITFARAGNLGGTLVASDVSGQTAAVAAVGDSFVFTDVNDGGLLKTSTIQDIVDLAAGGGDLLASNNLSDVGDTATSLVNIGGIGPSTSDVLINKSYDANGTGNVLTNVDIGNAIAASQAEAEAGTNNTKLVTSLRVSQAITALAGGGTNWTYVSGTVSGDDILFSSLPAGIKEIEMFATDLRQSADTPIEIQIGDSGGIETSGYHSVNRDFTAANTFALLESTAGFTINATVQSAITHSFMARLAKGRDDDDAWHCVSSGMDNPTGGDASHTSFGRKTLSAELTQIRLHKVTSGGAFDAGTLYIRHR